MKQLVWTASLAVVCAAAAVAARRAEPPGHPQAGAPPAVTLSPCDVPGVPGKARCGTFEVWENRQAKTGRRIGLKIVVLPATSGNAAKDAITFLAGGPGDAATRLAPFVADRTKSIRRTRDIVLVDQRGTGGSNPLECDLYPGTDAQAALGAFFPVDRVRACRAALEKKADLTQYTTPLAMDDLDDVRGALGYDTLDLFGGSYGTRAALVFLRRHPDRVRVAVLQGVAPTGDPMPLHFPQYAQRAIERVFADCAADASCGKAFPNLAADLRAIVERASSQAVPADVLDPRTGDRIHVSLSRDLLGESLRYLMYESSSALLVPDLVHQAAGGDFGPLAEFALFSRRQLVNAFGQGLYLSITCAEDLPFVRPADAERAAAGTFLGDYRYRQQRAACDAWVRAPIPADYREPVRSDRPVLLFSGTWDPVTPQSNAQEAAAALANALSIVIPAGGHDYTGLEGVDACTDAITTAFVERASTAGVDQSCIGRIRRPPFPTRALETKPVALTAEQLSAFVGRYTAAGAPPLEIRMERGKLSARLEGQAGALVVVPVSATRLRVLGALGNYLDAQVSDGKVTGMTLEQTGVKMLAWKKGAE